MAAKTPKLIVVKDSTKLEVKSGSSAKIVKKS